MRTFSSLVSSLFAIVLLTFWSCQPNSSSNGSSEEGAMAEAVPTAISIWNAVGLRDAPGNKAKYVTNIFFGEKVTLTGNQQEIPEEKRTYLEVTLSDGKIGWVNAFLMMENASLAAIVSPVSVCKRPDLTTMTGTSFSPGDLIAFTETDDPSWIQASGLEKKVSGYVRRDQGISTVENDVQVAVLLARASAEKDKKKKLALLESISNNAVFTTSPLVVFADEAATSIKERAALPANQLYITGDKVNIRSTPSTQGSEVVFQLVDGDVCTVLEKGESETINGVIDYWYQIDHNGQIGWVFGAFTSKGMNIGD